MERSQFIFCCGACILYSFPYPAKYIPKTAWSNGVSKAEAKRKNNEAKKKVRDYLINFVNKSGVYGMSCLILDCDQRPLLHNTVVSCGFKAVATGFNRVHPAKNKSDSITMYVWTSKPKEGFDSLGRKKPKRKSTPTKEVRNEQVVEVVVEAQAVA